MLVRVDDQFPFESFPDIKQVEWHLFAAKLHGVGQFNVVGKMVNLVEGEELMVGAFVGLHLLVIGLACDNRDS